MTNYEELKNLSDNINCEIKRLSEEGDSLLSENAKKFKRKLELKDHPHPIKFNKRVKYLIINVNPSVSEKDKFFLNDYLLMIDKTKFQELDNKKEIKCLDKILIFQYFHKKPFEMIKEIDSSASLFWEDKETWDGIYKNLMKEDSLNDEIKKILNKINNKIGINNPRNFVLFAEFFYYRHKHQRDISKIIDKTKKKKSEFVNKNLRELLKEFLKKQIDYYNPEYIIITNSYVSKFFEKEIMDISTEDRKISEIETIVNWKNMKIFLSTMFSSGNIDNYSVKRLQDEIKLKLKGI